MGRSRVEFSDEDISIIIEMFENGYSIPSINSKIDAICSDGTIINYIKMLGLVRDCGGRKRKLFCEICSIEFETTGPSKFCQTCIPSKDWIQRYRLYGITAPIYFQMFEAQSGLCGMCFGKLNADPLRTHIDHCHTTGVVRSILCGRCNNGLGYVEDRVLLQNALKYLEKHKEVNNGV